MPPTSLAMTRPVLGGGGCVERPVENNGHGVARPKSALARALRKTLLPPIAIQLSIQYKNVPPKGVVVTRSPKHKKSTKKKKKDSPARFLGSLLVMATGRRCVVPAVHRPSRARHVGAAVVTSAPVRGIKCEELVASARTIQRTGSQRRHGSQREVC